MHKQTDTPTNKQNDHIILHNFVELINSIMEINWKN